MDSQRAARIATFSVGIAVASYAAYQFGKLVQRKRHDAKNNTSCVELRPPFPDEVVQLLRSSVLCYLSTLADGAPHLSLMNFTYCPADEKIIMSTRRDTTKYRALLKNKRVAVLIHDFPAEERQRAAAASARAAGRSGDYAQTYSVTLYGSVQVETGAAAERLGWTDRGVVREGAVADLVVLDGAGLADTATFERPDSAPRGIEQVYIGGRRILDGADYDAAALAGTVIRA